MLTTFAELRMQTSGWISSAQDTLTDIKDSASDVFNSFKAQAASIQLPTVDRPAFFDRIKSTVNEMFTPRTSEETGEEGHGAEAPPEGGDGKGAAGVAALMAATMASPVEPDKEEKGSMARGGNDEGLMNLTRKLIGIRSILLSIDQRYARLPSFMACVLFILTPFYYVLIAISSSSPVSSSSAARAVGRVQY
jgi:hypothetical protein